MRGQLSAEMVILLVVIIAVIAVVASNLFKGAKTAGTGFSNESQKLTKNLEKVCFTDLDCPQGKKCVNGVCQ